MSDPEHHVPNGHPHTLAATNGSEFLPLSHNNPFLSAPDFSIEEFLLSRSYVSLPDLRVELRDYLAKLKEELVKLINDDYEAFISLSTDLKGEGTRLERLKHPLGGLKVDISVSKDKFSSIQDTISAKLDRRANLRDEQILLQLLLKISESITRLESFLSIPPSEQDNLVDPSETAEYRPSRPFATGATNEDHAVGRNSAKHLLRAATEYNQLIYHIDKALVHECVFISEVQWRVDRLKSTLTSDLEYFLSSTLKAFLVADTVKSANNRNDRSKSASDLKVLLVAYDMLHLWRDAEDVVRRDIVRGFVKKTIFNDVLSTPQSPVLPKTPLPLQRMQTSVQEPRTPYTPFSAFATKQNPFFADESFLTDGSNAYLLDDSNNPLAALYNKILRFIDRNLKEIAAIADRIGMRSDVLTSVESSDSSTIGSISSVGNDDGFDIMANVVLDEVGRAIMDDLGSSLFSLDNASDFRKRYEITQAFLRSLEYLAPSVRAVKHIRSHSVYTLLDKRWQLPSYYQLRWKQIATKVEESLQSAVIELSRPTLTNDGNDTESFKTRQAFTIWEAMLTCWSSDVYLPELSHDFWKLTLQLLSRYKGWLETSLPPLDPAVKLGSDKVSVSSAVSRSTTPVPHQEAVNVDRAVNDETLLKQCAAAIQDINMLNSKVWTQWREEISILLPDLKDTEDGISSAEDALNVTLQPLMELLGPLSSQLISILSRRACDALSPVKAIPGQFRATSHKHMPTKPSAYVSLIMRPLKVFFGVESAGGDGRALKDSYMPEISTAVFEAAVSRFMGHLTHMRKAEESLRRLKKGKKSGFSLFGGNSAHQEVDNQDDERVKTQLLLDVEAFGKDAELLGVDIQSSDLFKALSQMVRNSPSVGD